MCRVWLLATTSLDDAVCDSGETPDLPGGDALIALGGERLDILDRKREGALLLSNREEAPARWSLNRSARSRGSTRAIGRRFEHDASSTAVTETGKEDRRRKARTARTGCPARSFVSPDVLSGISDTSDPSLSRATPSLFRARPARDHDRQQPYRQGLACRRPSNADFHEAK
jgi:hypothetical protein